MTRNLLTTLAAVVLVSGIGGLFAADDARETAVKKELEKLQGTWLLIAGETNGEKVAEEQAKKIKVVIQGDHYSVYHEDHVIAKDVVFKVDPTRSPKTVEDILNEGPNKGKTVLGIYELQGNTLKSCVAPPGKERPKDFAAAAGSGCSLRIFKRQEP